MIRRTVKPVVVVRRASSVSCSLDRHVLGGIPGLRRLGYNPYVFLAMVERYRDPVGATRRL
jgi:hypothetical protein